VVVTRYDFARACLLDRGFMAAGLVRGSAMRDHRIPIAKALSVPKYQRIAVTC
jgi:hypothetical protein